MPIGQEITGPFGLTFGEEFVRVFNRTGATRIAGDVVRFDQTKSQAESTSVIPGTAESIYSNVFTTVAGAVKWGFYGIVVADSSNASLADNGLVPMKVCIRGRVPINVVGTDATAIGEPLFAAGTADTLSSDVVASSKVLGFAEAVTAGATEQQIMCLFNGIEGFGTG